MTDVLTIFCAAFAVLGSKLLFYNNQPVSFGAVFLTALISAAAAHLLSAGDATVLASNLLNRVTNLTCAYKDSVAPIQFACSMASFAGVPDAATGRFSEL